jgi:diguanylate cyclase (GGDEF)-like protein
VHQGNVLFYPSNCNLLKVFPSFADSKREARFIGFNAHFLTRGLMISLKRYLDSDPVNSDATFEPQEGELFSRTLAAYGSALVAMGSCSLDACPGLGNALRETLSEQSRKLTNGINCETLAATDREVQEQMQSWGRRTARHYQQKSDEVKDLLLVMARTAESVGTRDQRCAGQIHEVTARLTAIASLDDLTQIRASIEKSAADLKISIDRMTEEGKAAIDSLQQQVSAYRLKLEEAEEIASRDALTGLRSRLCVEGTIERHITAGAPFCVAIADIDGFKKVNDEYGHLTGDELLKQFATELIAACRSSDMIGRWGGDEFIIVLERCLSEASAQTDRLRKWICGNYTVQGKSTPQKIRVDASIGLAEYLPADTMKDLLARADAAMYQNKTATRIHSASK